jgi:hypothetical protein
MSDENKVMIGERETRSRNFPTLSVKQQRSVRFKSPSDGRIASNSKYAFTSYAMKEDVGFNPGIFGTETND